LRGVRGEVRDHDGRPRYVAPAAHDEVGARERRMIALRDATASGGGST